MIKRIRVFRWIWNMAVNNIKFILGKLSRKNAFTEFTRNSDPMKYIHNHSIIFVNRFSFTYSHAYQVLNLFLQALSILYICFYG